MGLVLGRIPVEWVMIQDVDWQCSGDHREPPVCVLGGRVKVGNAPRSDGETILRGKGCRE